MLHFFVDTGIKDTIYYWGEFKKVLKTYCELKKLCPELRAIDIGGGLPIRNSLGFEYDYSYMINEIVKQIKIAFGTVQWRNEQDVSPETLYLEGEEIFEREFESVI